MTVVLDSWAILRLLEGDHPAARSVDELLEAERPIVSWINLGEVFYVLARRHGSLATQTTLRDIRRVTATILPDDAIVLAAAGIKAGHAMAYADAFAAATAIEHDAELWTGDPELLLDGAAWRWRDLRNG